MKQISPVSREQLLAPPPQLSRYYLSRDDFMSADARLAQLGQSGREQYMGADDREHDRVLFLFLNGNTFARSKML